MPFSFVKHSPLSAVVLLCVVIVGCKSQPVATQSLMPPTAQVAIDQFAGTALTGALAKAPATDVLNQAWQVTANIVAVQTLPGDAFQLIGPAARLVLGTQPGNLLSPSTTLAYTTRYLQIKTSDALDAVLNEKTADLANLNGAIAVGTTASFSVELGDDAPINPTFARRKIAIEVYRETKSNAYELALVSQDLATDAKTSDQVNAETVVLTRTLIGDTDQLLISVPMKFPQSSAAGVVIDLTVNTKEPDHSTLAAMTSDVAANAQEAEGRIQQTNVAPDQLALSAALDAATNAPATGDTSNGNKPSSLRPVLAYLAEQADAKLSEAVILVADDNVLQLIQAAVRERAQKLPARDKKTVAWMLDRATISVIGSIKEEQAPNVLPPIIGALSIYAGEVGRQLDLLQSLANQSVSSDDLYARIVAEQQIALEDNSPAVRVRAYDWLNERGGGPAGYNPLGPARARQDALEKYHDVQATQPSIAK